MSKQAIEFYENRKNIYQDQLSLIKKRIRQLAWLRVIFFLLIFIPLFAGGWNEWFSIIASLVFAACFLFLVKKNILLEKKRKYHSILIQLSTEELLALNDQFSHFEDGSSFINPEHPNSHDLDLFGKGSLFQFLNRTSTQSGRLKLAEWLQYPNLNKREIEQRQEAIRELAGIPQWRLEFLASGHSFKESPEQLAEISSWPETVFTFKNPSFLSRIILVVPFLTIAAGAYAIKGGSLFWVIILMIFQVTFLFFHRKTVTQYYDYFGRKTELLEKYIQLIRYIENENFNASFLKDLQKKVIKPDKASHIFFYLKKIVKQFEYRQNIIINIIFNAVLMWDLRCTYKLWKWHNRYHKRLAAWLGVIAEADALISLANMAYNHPRFTYPEIHEGGFVLNAEQLGHPLIPPAKRVNNDFLVNGWGKVFIITGANMAGKSTFLRAAGVNMILGSTGAPVCAEKLVFTPVKIFTNMRTTDSLYKDESYFYAELKRIKTVLDQLEQGERIFVIFDEMLKGTNSVDKLNGSKQLIERLLELKAVALIATHDLKISEMEEDFPQMIYNKCFEIELINNEMKFDYKLRDGATKMMNASFLMKKMGIIR